MEEQFSRTELLLGKLALDKLSRSHVAVFGVGGVGGYVVEVLARSGIGAIDIIDNDKICVSNLNRQIVALHSTIGKYKVDVARQRILDINPECEVKVFKTFYLPDNANFFDFSKYDYVADCIDTVTAKIDIAIQCHKVGTPVISCMGAANKMDATAFHVTDIFNTEMDPLAKIMRKKLRKADIPALKVVYSTEQPIKPQEITDKESKEDIDGLGETKPRRTIPASNAFVPAAAGLIVGGEIVKDLIKQR